MKGVVIKLLRCTEKSYEGLGRVYSVRSESISYRGAKIAINSVSYTVVTPSSRCFEIVRSGGR